MPKLLVLLKGDPQGGDGNLVVGLLVSSTCSRNPWTTEDKSAAMEMEIQAQTPKNDSIQRI